MRYPTFPGRPWLPAVFCGCGLLALAGCGGVKLVPVTGKVVANGRPLAEGRVSFAPATDNPNKVVPRGRIKDGSYDIYTNGRLGAPLGRYKVTVTVPSEFETEPDAGGRIQKKPEPKGATANPLVHPRFGTPEKSPLEVTVVESPQAGAYDLKLTSR